MSSKETRYKVTGRITMDYEIIIQALDPQEAEYLSADIDLDSWKMTDSDWEVTGVTKTYFMTLIKNKEMIQQKSVSN